MNNELGITLPNLRKGQSAVKTAPRQFFSCTEEQKNLFSVNAGVPIIDALEQADCFFDAAEEALNKDLKDAPVSAVLYLLRFGRATLGSAITALIESRRSKETNNEPSIWFNDVASTPEFEEAKECVGRAFERMEDLLSSCISSVCTKETEGKEIVSARLNDSLFRLLAIVRKGKALADTVTAQGQNPVIVKDSPAFRFVR